MAVGVVLWIGMVWGAALIARRKGRSGERRAIAVALIGPPALVVLLCMDSALRPVPRPRLVIEVDITLREHSNEHK